MEIRQLRHAIALAATQNFARAAEKENISQPALSKSIQALERSIGLTLFDRDNRNVTIRQDALDFLDQARDIIRRCDHVKREIAVMNGLEKGKVTVGLGPYVTATYAAKIVTRVHQLSPGISIRVISDNWHNLLRQLREEKLDVFIADMRDIERAKDLNIQHVIEHEMFALCRKGHPIIQRQPLEFALLKEYPIVAAKIPRRVTDYYGEAPVVVNIDDANVLKQIVLESDLIGFSTWPLAKEEILDGRLHRLELKNSPRFSTNSAIVTLKNRSLSRATQFFLDQYIEMIEEEKNE